MRVRRLMSPCLLTAALLLSTACAGASVSSPTSLRPLPEPVSSIALAPSGGVMADAIGNELFNQGFQVIDTQETSNFLVRLNLSELEVLQPKSLSLLREQGITAFLQVRGGAGYDGRPQSVTVRVVSTRTGELIGGANWQNGKGGMQGSMADNIMRADVVEAAKKIGDALAPQLRRATATP